MESANVHDLGSASDRVLSKERRRILKGIDELERRVETHRELLEALEEQLSREQYLLREIEELTDQRPQMRLERLDRELRGRRLQEVAVEVLRNQTKASQPVHYREWFALVRAEGFEVAGRDPLNSFLTGISRAEGVERVGTRSGLYRLAN